MPSNIYVAMPNRVIAIPHTTQLVVSSPLRRRFAMPFGVIGGSYVL